MTRQEQFQKELAELMGRYDAELAFSSFTDSISFSSLTGSGIPQEEIKFDCGRFDKDGWHWAPIAENFKRCQKDKISF